MLSVQRPRDRAGIALRHLKPREDKLPKTTQHVSRTALLPRLSGQGNSHTVTTYERHVLVGRMDKAREKLYWKILYSQFGVPTSQSCKEIEDVKLLPVCAEQLEAQDTLKSTRKWTGCLTPKGTCQAGNRFLCIQTRQNIQNLSMKYF